MQRFLLVLLGLSVIACNARKPATVPGPTIGKAEASALPPDPAAEQARKSAIAGDAECVAAECQRAASGDWLGWEKQTAPYRAALKARIDRLGAVDDRHREALTTVDGTPMWEAGAAEGLGYLYDPSKWHGDRTLATLSSASRWSRTKGIHLIFCACPSMPSVYIEHFLDPTPPDGVIAPHVRWAQAALLGADVEAIDDWRLMRAARTGPFQFMPADHHHSQEGMKPAAREIAARLARYSFGRVAKASPAITRTATGPYVTGPYVMPLLRDLPWAPSGYDSFRPEQRSAVDAALPKSMEVITAPDGSPLTDDPASPVLLIGDSYAIYFRELLTRESNLRIRTHWSHLQDVGAWYDFLREPELLAGVRVVIWMTSERLAPGFKPLPGPIRSDGSVR
jgi:hypothetical protein